MTKKNPLLQVDRPLRPKDKYCDWGNYVARICRDHTVITTRQLAEKVGYNYTTVLIWLCGKDKHEGRGEPSRLITFMDFAIFLSSLDGKNPLVHLMEMVRRSRDVRPILDAWDHAENEYKLMKVESKNAI